MNPQDMQSLAAILGMPLSGLDAPGMGGPGAVPGMGQVPMGNGLPGANAVPGIFAGAPPRQESEAPKGKPDAALGLQAMQMLQNAGKPAPTMGAPGAAVAPRGNQVRLETPKQTDAIDPSLRLTMARMLFGGGR